jgi:hypothetical protein
MPLQIPVAARIYSDYTLCPDLAKKAVQGAMPTESYGNFGLGTTDLLRRSIRRQEADKAYAAAVASQPKRRPSHLRAVNGDPS